jgi:hypothetical protein
MGGGSKPSKPTPQPVPEAAKPLDYKEMFAASRENSRLIGQDQLDQLKAAYPEFEKLSLGTIQSYAAKLNNKYTANANAAVDAASGQAWNMVGAADRMGAVATRGEDLSKSAQRFAQGPTALDTQIASLGQNAMSQRADQVQGAKVSRVGDIDASIAENAMMNEAAGKGLVGSLEGQASSELALGRSLSPEQARAATQQARAGMSARGLGTGTGALAAEILNRDAYATDRQNQRRSFASGVAGQAAGIRQTANQAYLTRVDSNLGRRQQSALADAGYDQQATLANQDANQRQVEANRAFLQNANASGINSQITRGNYAMGQLGQSANMYGQQAATSANAAALGLNIANANLTIDPYQRAFAPGASFGQNVTGQAGGMLGQAYGNALNTVGNVETFNTNMLETRRNSALNNNASMQGAYMNAQAQQSAGQTGMWGSIAGGGLAAGGMIAGAVII